MGDRRTFTLTCYAEVPETPGFNIDAPGYIVDVDVSFLSGSALASEQIYPMPFSSLRQANTPPANPTVKNVGGYGNPAVSGIRGVRQDTIRGVSRRVLQVDVTIDAPPNYVYVSDIFGDIVFPMQRIGDRFGISARFVFSTPGGNPYQRLEFAGVFLPDSQPEAILDRPYNYRYLTSPGGSFDVQIVGRRALVTVSTPDREVLEVAGNDWRVKKETGAFVEIYLWPSQLLAGQGSAYPSQNAELVARLNALGRDHMPAFPPPSDLLPSASFPMKRNSNDSGWTCQFWTDFPDTQSEFGVAGVLYGDQGTTTLLAPYADSDYNLNLNLWHLGRYKKYVLVPTNFVSVEHTYSNNDEDDEDSGQVDTGKCLIRSLLFSYGYTVSLIGTQKSYSNNYITQPQLSVEAAPARRGFTPQGWPETAGDNNVVIVVPGIPHYDVYDSFGLSAGSVTTPFTMLLSSYYPQSLELKLPLDSYFNQPVEQNLEATAYFQSYGGPSLHRDFSFDVKIGIVPQTLFCAVRLLCAHQWGYSHLLCVDPHGGAWRSDNYGRSWGEIKEWQTPWDSADGYKALHVAYLGGGPSCLGTLALKIPEWPRLSLHTGQFPPDPTLHFRRSFDEGATWSEIIAVGTLAPRTAHWGGALWLPYPEQSRLFVAQGDTLAWCSDDVGQTWHPFDLNYAPLPALSNENGTKETFH